MTVIDKDELFTQIELYMYYLKCAIDVKDLDWVNRLHYYHGTILRPQIEEARVFTEEYNEWLATKEKDQANETN